MCLLCCCCLAFNNCTSICIDVTLLVLNSLSTILSLLALIIIQWKNVSSFSLFLMIFLFVLDVSLVIMSSLIVCWRKGGSIKDSTKQHAYRMATAGMALSIIVFIACIISDISLAIDFTKANYPCNYFNYQKNYYNIRRLAVNKDDIDCTKYYTNKNMYFEVVTFGEYLIAYFCISFTEIAMILSMMLWSSSKRRIIEGIFGAIVVQQPTYAIDPYGVGSVGMQPQVIMVQGNQYGQQGMYAAQYPAGYGNMQTVYVQPQQNPQLQQNQNQPQQEINNIQYEKPGINQVSSGRNL